MKTTKPTTGSSAVHEPRHTACASSSPAMPTYTREELESAFQHYQDEVADIAR